MDFLSGDAAAQRLCTSPKTAVIDIMKTFTQVLIREGLHIGITQAVKVLLQAAHRFH